MEEEPKGRKQGRKHGWMILADGIDPLEVHQCEARKSIQSQPSQIV
jgi:hypothetical protein